MVNTIAGQSNRTAFNHQVNEAKKETGQKKSPVDLALINRRFELNMFVDVHRPHKLSSEDMTALQRNDFNRVAQLIFDNIKTSTQPLNLSHVEHQCGLTGTKMFDLENPVVVKPMGIFELKALLAWWLEKGTDPKTEKKLALTQIEKILLPSNAP